VNFETRDRGTTPAGLAEARGRLLAMVDVAMDRCAPIAGLRLRPPEPPRTRPPGKPVGKRKRR